MDVLNYLPAHVAPWMAFTLIAISFLTSAISAAFGIGGGVAMLLALLSFTTPVIALPVHALVQFGSNAGRAWMLRPHIMNSVLTWFVPGSIVGVLLASQLIVSLPLQWLEILLGVFILWSIFSPGFATMKVADSAYLGVGAATSFATMFLGATGPLLAIFVAPDRYGRDKTVATHAACMAFQHLIKVVAFGFLGFVLSEWLPLVLAMILSGLVGTRMGRSLLYRLPKACFRLAFKSVLTLLALRLIYKAILG